MKYLKFNCTIITLLMIVALSSCNNQDNLKFEDECEFISSFFESIDDRENDELIEEYFLNSDSLSKETYEMYGERINLIRELDCKKIDCESKSVDSNLILVKFKCDGEKIPFRLLNLEDGSYKFSGFIPITKGTDETFWM